MNYTICAASFSAITELHEKDLYPVYEQLVKKIVKNKQKYIYNMTSL